ncbi:MAG: malonyl-ACP O-methyltransferase BioC [Burkholderiales bacterium]|nr:malonyl-ACP O-methyltransferase BioC [Burkholderiales bacterium]
MSTNQDLFPPKPAVRRSFGDAAKTYDGNAFLQREIADRLFERLQYIKLQPATVLDVGCGTGYATAKLRERYTEANIIGLDLAPQMLVTARSQAKSASWLKRVTGRAPSLCWLCSDAESLPFKNESIDFVMSNLTLQWCNPEIVAKEVVRVLKPNGLFMFTTLGPDTLKELRAAFRAVDDKPHVNKFVDMHDIGDILVHAGFADPVMDQEVITLTYNELKPLLKELKGIGAHNVQNGRSTGLMGRYRWQRMVTAYEAFRKGERLPATYEVVYGHARKPAFMKRKTIDGQQTIDINEFKRMVGKS